MPTGDVSLPPAAAAGTVGMARDAGVVWPGVAPSVGAESGPDGGVVWPGAAPSVGAESGPGAAAAALARYRRAALGVFQPSLVLASGEGALVRDVAGREYLDLLGGIAVNVLGHAHPAWVDAVARQAGRLAHVSNFYATEPQIELAARLLTITGADGGGRVFLANSGTEANEAALKAVLRLGGSRHRILALEGAFHGRTLGALSLTAKESYRKPYDPFTGPVEFLPHGDLAALTAAFAEGGLAALVLEVIQGEAGVRPLPPGYLAAARRLTEQHGALLWIDEVQTGIGRTGYWMAYQDPAFAGEPAGSGRAGDSPAGCGPAGDSPAGDSAAACANAGVLPDIVTLAKGLGGGFPIGAMVAMNQRAAGLLQVGDHGTTFGGNPLASAAALATLDIIERGHLTAHARELGARWRAELAKVDGVRAVRGAGLLVGIVLEEPNAPAVVRRAQAAGFLLNAPTPDVLRLAPPLILSQDQADRFTAALGGLLKVDPLQVEGNR
ncbi:MAG: aminotransferase class III-fold pyridoxal phosphate-dependent enzyme [Bifidobacteriaceae bacterium]|jgi:acetylornithine aminotransferase|nr:aminotransferase class III-fold pyridoxal phosphate-dependent enzyme [Bifidobacteriaceae bacterium]